MNDTERRLLRHFLATLAYRTQKLFEMHRLSLLPLVLAPAYERRTIFSVT